MSCVIDTAAYNANGRFEPESLMHEGAWTSELEGIVCSKIRRRVVRAVSTTEVHYESECAENTQKTRFVDGVWRNDRSACAQRQGE